MASTRRYVPKADARHGAAMVEAVIALPVLVLVLFGVTYVHDLYAAKQTTLLQARAQAWRKALVACNGASDGAASRPRSKADSVSAYANTNHPGPQSVIQRLENIPVLGTLIGTVLPASTQQVVDLSVRRPAVVGKGSSSLRGRVYLLCNDKRRDPWEIIQGVVGKIVPGWG